MTTAIEPDRILKELAELWVSLGKQSDQDHPTTGVLRACAMTLVTVVEQSDDPMTFGETLAALMREHPSRAIVIRLDPSRERVLDSKVFAQCWMPFGQRRQICCEQVEITASLAGLPDVPAVVLPLAVADLPVVIWYRSPRLFRIPALEELSRIAGKIILDSTLLPDPRSTLLQLSASLSSGRIIADLAWTRVTRWREVLAQVYENPRCCSLLGEIVELTIGYAGEEVPIAAYYLAGWVLQCLEKIESRPNLRFEPARTGTPGQLRSIELRGTASAEARISVTLLDGNMAQIRAERLENRTMLPVISEYAALREELSIHGPDAIYESALARAARLAS